MQGVENQRNHYGPYGKSDSLKYSVAYVAKSE